MLYNTAFARDTYVGPHNLVGLHGGFVVRLHRGGSRRMVLVQSDFLVALNDGLDRGEKLPVASTSCASAWPHSNPRHLAAGAK